ncbi:MAG TPA: WecB/TagA/CpsF family glycosyltransferase [Chloroflexia bacterium]|nr:WecB/TagA/CpsF family glycosyltransferase [Chloroflexia bacterium]
MALCEAEAACLSVTDSESAFAPDYPGARPFLPAARDCTDIMGVLIDRTHRARVLAQIDAFVQSGRPHQVVTVNVDFLNIAYQDRSFVRLLNDAAIAVPDGMPLLWVSRLVGQPLPERITGTDLLCGCAELAARQGYRLFLLGAAPGVAAEAAQVLESRYPHLQIVGTYAPPERGEFDPAENARIVAMIRAAQPEMLFVALGTPKQEKWIYRNLDQLGVPVCVGVGGVFNFITGRIPRAPQMLQRAGLEWLFRLVLEPRRLWRRYLIDDTHALYRALRYSFRQRHQARAEQPRASAVPVHPLGPEAVDWHLAARETTASVVASVPAPDA